jgi:hypothetical protein
VPGEDKTKVTDRLADPAQYDGCRVLVVGGGDSAVEAAIQLARQSTAEVTVSYRGQKFTRCRAVNQGLIEELAAEGRLACHFGTHVERIDDAEVTLRRGDGRGTFRLPNDFVLLLVGGELPVEFLTAMGVEMRRYHGERHKGRDHLHGVAGLDDERTGRVNRRQETVLYALAGALILAGLSWVGRGYYSLGTLERLHSPLHGALRSAGTWGHGVGIAATLVMMGNFLYALRKRHPKLKGFGAIGRWLDFHVFVGFMSPLVIAFHAAFRSRNHLATATTLALVVVVVTGVIGRFLYGLAQARAQARDSGNYKNLLGNWRVLHASLAGFLVLAIALHIGVSLYFGYALGSAE